MLKNSKNRKERTANIVLLRNILLVPALIAGLGLLSAGRLTAQTVANFNSFSIGGNPVAELLLSSNSLYGPDDNMIFAITTDGTGFTNLHNFSVGSNGVGPGGLILFGKTLYGSSAGGGLGYGTLFAINTDGTEFSTLRAFAGTNDGNEPLGGLIISGTTLFGTTVGGGSAGCGIVFAFNILDPVDLMILHSFTAFPSPSYTNSDGANPYAGLILSGNTLYGTTYYGGISCNGTVFAVKTDRSGFTNLHNFTGLNGSTNPDGANPMAGLILLGNTLYGTASMGGNSGNGTVFAINTDGTDFTNLHSFSAGIYDGVSVDTNSDGARPVAGLISSGNTLYGDGRV